MLEASLGLLQLAVLCLPSCALEALVLHHVLEAHVLLTARELVLVASEARTGHSARVGVVNLSLLLVAHLGTVIVYHAIVPRVAFNLVVGHQVRLGLLQGIHMRWLVVGLLAYQLALASKLVLVRILPVLRSWEILGTVNILGMG